MTSESTVPLGGSKAEVLFRQGLNYHLGRKDTPYNPAAARELYLKAPGQGSAKAALNLVWLARSKARMSSRRADDLSRMIQYFVQAAKMGSPDALYCLHEACSQGLGVPKDRARAEKLLRSAARGGSLLAMTKLGLDCVNRDELEEGREWLGKALDRGYGDAGYHLGALAYTVDQDVKAMVRCLERGAGHGSVKCIRRLALIHELGQFGQQVDMPLAEHYRNLLPKNKTALSGKTHCLPVLSGDGHIEAYA